LNERKTWLDIAVIQCPHCGRFYSDASWYVIEIGSDIECGTCHRTFNTKKHVSDRMMLELSIDEKGRVTKAEMAKRV